MTELIYIYSHRNRIEDDKLNVYNGGQIIYDFDAIEKILQKEFVYGKRKFVEKQKTFIFSILMSFSFWTFCISVSCCLFALPFVSQQNLLILIYFGKSFT